VKCYLLIETPFNRGTQVARAITALITPKDVELVDAQAVSGIYDVIATLRGDREAVARFLGNGGITHIDGVLNVFSCLELD
jgi:hypothetical protein